MMIAKLLRLACFRGLLLFAAVVPSLAKDSFSAVTSGEKRLPMAGEALRFGGRDAFVILPEKAAEGAPWVWYAPTLPNLPGKAELWLFERFLKEGIAIAGVDVGESYGSPDGSAIFQNFYQYLVKERHLSPKPCLLARSRGGLMLYNWAVEHPESVSGIAGIYPVCNIASYPGIAKASGAYHMTSEQLAAKLNEHNPIDRLTSLAKAGVPLHHLHGDSDKVVPLELNSGELARRYRELGGPMDLEIVKGGGHNMWAGWFQSKDMATFITRHAKAGAMEAPAK